MKAGAIFFSILVCGINISSSCQTRNDCHTLSNRQLESQRLKSTEPDRLSFMAEKDINLLAGCSEVYNQFKDSKYLSGMIFEFAGLMLSTHIVKNQPVTYGALVRELDSIFAYGISKKAVNQSDKCLQALLRPLSSPEHLEDDILTLTDMELLPAGDDWHNLIKAAVMQQKDNFKNLDEVFVYLKQENIKKQEALNAEKHLPHFDTLTNYTSALRKAKENGKPLLIYFSGHSCINARKLEQRVLTLPHIAGFIDSNFTSMVAIVDDNKYSKMLLTLQERQFNTLGQPYLCIVDANNNKIAEQFYTDDPEKFLSFLKKGLAEPVER